MTIVSKVPKNTPPEVVRLFEASLRTRSRPCSCPRGRPYRPSLAWMDELRLPCLARSFAAAIRSGRCADRHRLRGPQRQFLSNAPAISYGWWAGSGLLPPRLMAPSIGRRDRDCLSAARGEAREGEPLTTAQGRAVVRACFAGEAQATRSKLCFEQARHLRGMFFGYLLAPRK